MLEPRPALLIPAYRPDARLETLLARLLEGQTFSRILVVDDGSGEPFRGLFERLRATPGVEVLTHAINLGKGAALKTGFNHLLVTGGEHLLVTVDADGRYRPPDIVRVAEVGTAQPDALVLGVGSFGRETPWRLRMTNGITRLVMRFATGVSVRDTQAGLRAWPRDVALAALRIPINGDDFETEALVSAWSALSAGTLKLVQVPVEIAGEAGGHGRRFNPLLDSTRIYFVFLRFCGAGLFTALVDNLAFIGFYATGHGVLASQVVSRVSGATVSFLLSREVVFHSHANWAVALLRFAGLVALLGVLSYGMIHFSTVQLGMAVIPAKILVELILFAASFTLQRDFVFR